MSTTEEYEWRQIVARYADDTARRAPLLRRARIGMRRWLSLLLEAMVLTNGLGLLEAQRQSRSPTSAVDTSSCSRTAEDDDA